jgi:hypothetical protein
MLEAIVAEAEKMLNSFCKLSDTGSLVVTNHERYCGFEDCRDTLIYLLKGDDGSNK